MTWKCSVSGQFSLKCHMMPLRLRAFSKRHQPSSARLNVNMQQRCFEAEDSSLACTIINLMWSVTVEAIS